MYLTKNLTATNLTAYFRNTKQYLTNKSLLYLIRYNYTNNKCGVNNENFSASVLNFVLFYCQLWLNIKVL